MFVTRYFDEKEREQRGRKAEKEYTKRQTVKEEQKSYEEMTKAELIEILAERGKTYDMRHSKQTMLDALGE